MHEFWFEEDNEGYGRDDDDELFDAWECVFGERCCMPGLHTRDECHTAEMAEEWMSAEA